MQRAQEEDSITLYFDAVLRQHEQYEALYFGGEFDRDLTEVADRLRQHISERAGSQRALLLPVRRDAESAQGNPMPAALPIAANVLAGQQALREELASDAAEFASALAETAVHLDRISYAVGRLAESMESLGVGGGE